jgi:DNA-binding GntR family transcriptional regulator
MSPLEFSYLLELHEGSNALVDRGDFDGYDNFNRQFHEAIYAATHNAFLAEQALAIRVRLRAFRRTQRAMRELGDGGVSEAAYRGG